MLKRMSRGFTLVELMVVMAIVALARYFILWHIDAQRAREAELLFIGDQCRQAIRSYYELDPAQPFCRKASTVCWKTTAAPA